MVGCSQRSESVKNAFKRVSKMRLLVAPDSFKGTLSALEICQIIEAELGHTFPIISHPLADGGEGTLEAIFTSLSNSQWIELEVCGPLPKQRVKAKYLWLIESQEAFIEMGQASGLTLLKTEERNPELTTTYGTGELIRHALKQGAKKIYLAIGGSATNDAGLGMLMALGWQFLNKKGESVGYGGQALINIDRLIAPENLHLPPITVLCDVTNPLYGEQGAAFVYGPQKGGDRSMLERLDRGLQHFAAVIKKQYGMDLNFAGAGAAGGLGAGAKFGLDATIESGFRVIASLTGLEEKIQQMANGDRLITGEGNFDQQSLQGKVISGILALAKKYQRKVIILAGNSQLTNLQNYPEIEKIITLVDQDISLEQSLKEPDSVLRKRCQSLREYLQIESLLKPSIET